MKFDGWPRKTIGRFFHTTPSFVHHFKAISEAKLELQSGNAQVGSKLVIFCPAWPWNLMDFLPCDHEIWRMSFKNIRTPPVSFFKLCASFRTHWWIQTGVTVRKRPIWVKIDDFLSRVTLEFHGWPWKTIENLFFTILSFVHHFKAMSEFSIELQSGNAQFGSKSTIFCPVRPWNLADDLENNRAPFLCCFKLCASFHSHWLI